VSLLIPSPRKGNSPGLGRTGFVEKYHGTEPTHPVCASLDHPLSGFAAKRVEKKRNENPLYAQSGERDDKRSDVGVSR